MREYKSIQMLASISMIGGPLSLLFGGVLLSTAAIVCGIVALVLLRGAKVRSEGAGDDAIAQNLLRQAIIGTAVSAVALVLNAVALATVLPSMLDAMRTGDYSSMLNGATGSSASGSAFDSSSGSAAAPQSSGSIWG